jgi:hypothetical protein
MVNGTLASIGATLLGALAIAGCGGSAGPNAPVGVFEPLPGAPPAFAGVSGSAKLTNGPDSGSDVAVTLAGLKPNTAYVSHLHVGDCDQPGPGGPHFKFDLDGPEAPPNEIHLSFASNATGHASANVHSTMRVPAGTVRSIVVHGPAGGSDPGAVDVAAASGHTHHHGGSGDEAPGAAGVHAHGLKVACAALRPPGDAREP